MKTNNIQKALRWLYAGGVSIVLVAILWLFVISSSNGFFLLSCCLLLLFLLAPSPRKTLSYCDSPYTPVSLFLLSFVVRYAYCLFMNPRVTQISDFHVLFSEAISGSFVDQVDYYRYFSHKFLYPYLLHIIGAHNQRAVFLVQCLLVSVTPVVLYAIGKDLLDEKCGILSALFFIFWPAQIVYTSITSEEHLSALITVLCFFELFDCWNRMEHLKEGTGTRKELVQLVVRFVIVGVLFGASSFTKDWASIILVALLIAAVYLLFRYNKKQKIMLVAGICLIILSRSAFQSTATRFISTKLGGEESHNNIIVLQMFESLDPNGTGAWDQNLVNEYFEIVERNDNDFKAANEEAMSLLKQRISDSLTEMPAFLLKKGRYAYGNDGDIFWWAFNAEMQQDYYEMYEGSVAIANHIGDIWYFLMVAGIFLSILCIRNEKVFFVQLTILGTILSSLLIECQGRYKYSIEPIWTIAVAFAICTIRNKIRDSGKGISDCNITSHKL